ncbi:MAG: GNAT family N-acetyltransferase, partial [Lachnospiraceae bacterium]|nr:GNAT family N-acetyltransferase [Lachnospiraceae bacterium]
VGYLLYNEIGDETELLRIAVDKRYRGRHIASELLSIYKDKTTGKCSRGLLEVRSGNVIARRLYEQAGYKVLSIRKNYYSNPSEDGIVYEIILELAE